MRVLALIDGEHYPPVVRFALEELRRGHDVVGAAFLGGTEKVEAEAHEEVYGVPVVTAPDALSALTRALERFSPEVVVDLSDEPVVSAADRFVLATAALRSGARYVGADFAFDPPRTLVRPVTPTLGILGTGKRVGKTAISAYAARRLKAGGTDLVVLAMGRGGPEEPELIRGDEVRLTTPDLLRLARQGKHASSDNYEDAVMSRVTTVGCRRCGGGMAGETFFSNVPAGARLADSLGKELLIAEGSGAAIPPVAFDAAMLVVGAGRGLTYLRDHFGPFRLALADLVVLATAEEPNASAEEVAALKAFAAEARPGIPCVATTFRPKPIESVEGRRVFFASTAPPEVLPVLVGHLRERFGCEVTGSSPHLSDRARLREDMAVARGSFDVLLTELKAAAIDVVAAAGEDAGVPTVLCDNVPVAVDGQDLGALVEEAAAAAVERGRGRAA
ncbi:MAG: 2,3-diphosphoglycerate synthetase [Coriobacteriia bacterium]|nr:2,3-diphosphoglycerate synthetase [Coriobacteriia bacterium]